MGVKVTLYPGAAQGPLPPSMAKPLEQQAAERREAEKGEVAQARRKFEEMKDRVRRDKREYAEARAAEADRVSAMTDSERAQYYARLQTRITPRPARPNDYDLALEAVQREEREGDDKQ